MNYKTCTIQLEWQWTPHTPVTTVHAVIHFPEPYMPTLPNDPACPDVNLTILVPRHLGTREAHALDEHVRDCAVMAIHQLNGVDVPDGHAVNMISEYYEVRLFV